MADRRIKAVWIMSTNPLVSLPDADRARAALDACDLVVVSDCMRHTDTTRHADVLLPATAWGEKDGTVTNSERRISRQRPFLPAPGSARADWRTVCDVARRMGFSGFDYPNAAEIFREHAALSGFENQAEGFAPRPPHTLSGGQKQRVALGRAPLRGPSSSLLDEPLAAVDDSLKGPCAGITWNKRCWSGAFPRRTLTHDAGELARLARQVVRLEAGRRVPAS